MKLVIASFVYFIEEYFQEGMKNMDKRKRILKMVEEGKLTVDEALTLLEQLDKSNNAVDQTHEQFNQDVSNVIDDDGMKKEKTSQQQQSFHSTKDKFFDLVDSALKKIKDLDLDLNFGKPIEVSHIFQHSDATVRHVDIDMANGNVNIVPWDQKDIRIECNAKVYRGQTQEEAKQNFLKDVTFEVRENRLFFITGQKWIKLETVFYIPQADYDYLEVRLFNGKIEAKDINASQLKAKTANGKINVEGFKGSKVEVETANGAIHLLNCEAEEVDAETLTGAITIDGSFRKGEFQSFNGNIECNLQGMECEIINAKATTGSIHITVPDNVAVNGELKSNLGNCRVDMSGIQVVEEKSDIIQKVMIFKSVEDPEHALRIYADAKTGSINVQKG